MIRIHQRRPILSVTSDKSALPGSTVDTARSTLANHLQIEFRLVVRHAKSGQTARSQLQRLGTLTDVVYAVALVLIISWLPLPEESRATGAVWILDLWSWS